MKTVHVYVPTSSHDGKLVDSFYQDAESATRSIHMVAKAEPECGLKLSGSELKKFAELMRQNEMCGQTKIRSLMAHKH